MFEFLQYRGHCAVSCAKTAEPIEMPFWILSQVDLRNHILDAGTDPPWEEAILWGKGIH